MEKSKIVHLMCCEKFTSGYINFMKMKLAQYDHFFIIHGDKYELKTIDETNIYRVVTVRDIIRDSVCRKLLTEADKVIVSGVFGIERYLMFLSGRIWKKMYLQFWGGDFYVYKDKELNFKMKLYKQIMRSAIRRSKAVLTLIDDDYPAMEKVFHLKKNHYTVAMPADPMRDVDIDKIRDDHYRETSRNTIIIGNSATKENQHLELLDMLARYKDEDIRIYCPLSYGDSAYREVVIEHGKTLFGDKFIPVTEYMDYKSYVQLLAKCDVGMFNNNRQQAMGNIWLLAELGKKLYLRDDTTMWKHFGNWGLHMYPISELAKSDIAQLFAYRKEEMEDNCRVMSTREQVFIEAWENVLQD